MTAAITRDMINGIMMKVSSLPLYSLIIAGVLTLLSVTAVSGEQTGSKTQYNNILYQSTLEPGDGSDVLIREAYFPPGWKAPRHYHNANLFIYVIAGEFEVELEGSEKKVYTAGDALQMKAHTPMDAKNPSGTEPLKLAVFQVGAPAAPFVVPVE
jgi:quercetin dioxygenase-like cupin family protein